jgi:hypoxanthine-DNA glycosylase
MASLFDWPPGLAYDERCRRLCDERIALWDVIASCRRRGSADAAIDRATMRLNPVADLLQRTPSIEVVACNGGAAGREFERHILPGLTASAQTLRRYTLPSTSPAMARLSLAEKVEAWRILLAPSAAVMDDPGA